MQRKNCFLTNNTKNKRSGFAMIMAVGVIILISGIMLLTLKTTALTSKRTVDLYLYEQAELHTKGAIEYALYQIATNGCQNDLNISALDDIYNINISMKYAFTNETGAPTTTTTNELGIACNNLTPNTAVTTEEQNGSVMMDVTVTIPTSVTGTEPITFFRRTIQKL